MVTGGKFDFLNVRLITGFHATHAQLLELFKGGGIPHGPVGVVPWVGAIARIGSGGLQSIHITAGTPPRPAPDTKWSVLAFHFLPFISFRSVYFILGIFNRLVREQGTIKGSG